LDFVFIFLLFNFENWKSEIRNIDMKNLKKIMHPQPNTLKTSNFHFCPNFTICFIKKPPTLMKKKIQTLGLVPILLFSLNFTQIFLQSHKKPQNFT